MDTFSDESSPYEVVVFGATSFVGRLTAAYLAKRYGESLSWAIAGRSAVRLAEVARAIGLDDMPQILADAADASSLAELCRKTRVVVSTVGPYARYGEALVRVAAENGTDYCDLTGEVPWIARMIARYESVAQANGARMVHCCGFDSLPSDLGVHHLQALAAQRFGVPCVRIKMRVRAMRGSFSGGTVASLVDIVTEARGNPELRRELADAYSLCPSDKRPHITQPSVRSATYDRTSQAWIAPFVMAPINEHVVHRSNALTAHGYGVAFCYDEAVLMGRGLRGRTAAYGLVAALGAFVAGVAFLPTRALLQRFVLPAPGEGPSPEAQAKGFFDIRFFGETDDGRMLRTRVTGDRDPGYGATSKMLGEAAVCLARDIGPEDPAGGFWTPATILGDALIRRLIRNAGVTFESLDEAV